MTRRVAEIPGPSLARALGAESILLLPTGAIEHHGEHLPLGTDYFMAHAVAEAAAEAAADEGVDVWLLPALAYTKSNEHLWAPGTMTLSTEALLATLTDLGRSVAATPARKLVFLNGHGGNAALLQVALRELRLAFGLETFLMSFPVPASDGREGPDEHGMPIHGGFSETSLMLFLRPDLVDMTRAERSVPEHLDAYDRIGFHGAPVLFGWLSNDFGDSGVIGDPRGATAQVGARVFDEAVRGAVLSLKQIARFDRAGRSPG
ncbi:creatinine amidohydrolase [Microbacterium sp. SLBN-154]|uniref:creatininase family protein n=1 Tax=Microbacterium sp. SLBN-154 TaxID=2768458 RepID=UPI00114EE921|nr:creatininase family protein [Microbacterium sp. SLBN-154]TQK17643.1 creatinine amidohydrolase [Microbacterium sp. SLBN-154]